MAVGPVFKCLLRTWACMAADERDGRCKTRGFQHTWIQHAVLARYFCIGGSLAIPASWYHVGCTLISQFLFVDFHHEF